MPTSGSDEVYGPAPAKTLYDHAYRALYDAILHGRLKPGTRILQAEVSEALGISRGPLREAMSRLESEGLLVTTAQRGMRVAIASGEDVVGLYMVRAVLEGFAAASGLDRIRASVLPVLRQELEPMARAASQGAWADVADLDARWHSRIVEAYGNDRLLAVWSKANAPLRVVFAMAAPSFYQQDDVQRRHGELLELLAEARPAEIETAIRLHYRESAETFARFIDSQTERK